MWKKDVRDDVAKQRKKVGAEKRRRRRWGGYQVLPGHGRGTLSEGGGDDDKRARRMRTVRNLKFVARSGCPPLGI